MKRLQLELASQSQSSFGLSHSEKDKLASVSYDVDTRTIGYEAYEQTKATIANNTVPSAPNFEPAYISNTEREMVSPISYHQKFGTLNKSTPPPLPQKPTAYMKRSASAPEISAYRFEISRVLIDAEEYFDSVRV